MSLNKLSKPLREQVRLSVPGMREATVVVTFHEPVTLEGTHELEGFTPQGLIVGSSEPHAKSDPQGSAERCSTHVRGQLWLPHAEQFAQNACVKSVMLYGAI